MAKSSTASSRAKKKAPASKAPAAKAASNKATSTKATSTKAASSKASTATKATAPKPEKKPKFKKVSRAVTRLVEPGSQVDCSHCEERVKFQAKMRHQQVICNVYEKHKWVRVEHFHADCYKKAGEPFGKPID